LLKVLGIETSFGPGRLALLEGENPAGKGKLPPGVRHSSGIVPLLGNLLEEAGWRPSDLGLIAIGLGPGSFTGLRIAAALGQGLAFALEIPLIGVGSFAAMASSLTPSADEICVLSDARRSRAYAARYRCLPQGLKEISPPSLVPFAELVDFVKASTAFSPFPGELAGREDLVVRPVAPSPLEVARLAARRLRSGDPGEPGALRPIYLGGHYRVQGGGRGAA